MEYNYVIACYSNLSDEDLYISKNGYWNHSLTEAEIFSSKMSAKKYIEKHLANNVYAYIKRID